MGIAPKILMVDDDSEDIYLMRRTFNSTSWNGSFSFVTDPEQACKVLGLDVDGNAANTRDQENKPDLIILDLNMPGISGVELLKLIRSNKRLNTTPVVILSTSAEEKDIEAVYAHGANSYLQKPDTSAGMARLVERFLYYWFSMNMTPIRAH